MVDMIVAEYEASIHDHRQVDVHMIPDQSRMSKGKYAMLSPRVL